MNIFLCFCLSDILIFSINLLIFFVETLPQARRNEKNSGGSGAGGGGGRAGSLSKNVLANLVS